jgi:hypothetical protein
LYLYACYTGPIHKPFVPVHILYRSYFSAHFDTSIKRMAKDLHAIHSASLRSHHHGPMAASAAAEVGESLGLGHQLFERFASAMGSQTPERRIVEVGIP